MVLGVCVHTLRFMNCYFLYAKRAQEPMKPLKPTSSTLSFLTYQRSIEMKKRTTIKSKDLPGLRAKILGYAETEGFPHEFRTICVDAIEAIDRAVAEDVATNARLKLALDRFVQAGNFEG